MPVGIALRLTSPYDVESEWEVVGGRPDCSDCSDCGVRVGIAPRPSHSDPGPWPQIPRRYEPRWGRGVGTGREIEENIALVQPGPPGRCLGGCVAHLRPPDLRLTVGS